MIRKSVIASTWVNLQFTSTASSYRCSLHLSIHYSTLQKWMMRSIWGKKYHDVEDPPALLKKIIRVAQFEYIKALHVQRPYARAFVAIALTYAETTMRRPSRSRSKRNIIVIMNFMDMFARRYLCFAHPVGDDLCPTAT